MFEQIQSEMVKQGQRAVDMNQKVMSWQLEQAEKLQIQLREQSLFTSKLVMDSMRIGMDSFLAAQRATLDAMVPAQKAAADQK